MQVELTGEGKDKSYFKLAPDKGNVAPGTTAEVLCTFTPPLRPALTPGPAGGKGGAPEVMITGEGAYICRRDVLRDFTSKDLCHCSMKRHGSGNTLSGVFDDDGRKKCNPQGKPALTRTDSSTKGTSCSKLRVKYYFVRVYFWRAGSITNCPENKASWSPSYFRTQIMKDRKRVILQHPSCPVFVALVDAPATHDGTRGVGSFPRAVGAVVQNDRTSTP